MESVRGKASRPTKAHKKTNAPSLPKNCLPTTTKLSVGLGRAQEAIVNADDKAAQYVHCGNKKTNLSYPYAATNLDEFFVVLSEYVFTMQEVLKSAASVSINN